MAAVEAIRRHRYDRDRGRFKPWLKSVVYYKVIDARQSRPRAANFSSRDPRGDARVRRPNTARHECRGSETIDNVIDPHPTPAEEFEAAFEAEWQKVAFEEALDEIRREVDPATFQAFDLYARKNVPPRKVAKLLGLTRNAVYIAKTRVLARVNELLESSANPE